jgi:S1-C subfamily serine protease
MSEIDPIPAPPPSPEGWFAPPPYAPAPPPAQPFWGRWIAVVTVVATILAAGGGLGIGLTMARYLHNSSPVTQTATLPQTSEPPTSSAPISAVPPSSNNGTINAQAIVAKVDPAIVDINTVVQTSNGTGAAAGTGMIVTPSGEVLTNNHVVDGSISITVTIAGRSGNYSAHVIGVSTTNDVALLQIDGGVSGLPTVTLADASNLKVGDPVVAIGNALGQGGTPSATQGQITAIDQTITASEGGGKSETLDGLIQSDGTISPGDSGGALVNSAGQVIGMITAGEATGFRSSTSNVAYSITTNTALSVVNQIRAGQAGNGVFIGPVGYIGVGIKDQGGAFVTAVQGGSPAQKAGITVGSLITAVGSTSVDSTATLGNALHVYKPGASVAVTWLDANNSSHTKALTLTTGPNI